MGSFAKSFTLLLVVVFIVSLGVFQSNRVEAQIKTIIVPDDYLTIQDAVDNASVGTNILVRSGIYNQAISVNKSINLIGEDAKTTILSVPTIYTTPVGPIGAPSTSVIKINADNVEISNFTLKNANINGIGLNANGSGNMVNNIVINNIYKGIAIEGSSQIIFQNNISNAFIGIACSGSNNQIIHNDLTSDTTCFSLIGSFNNVTENSIIDNGNGIAVILQNANTNLIYNNTLNPGAIWLGSSNYNIIYANTVTKGWIGLGDPISGPASNNFVAANTIEQANGWAVLMAFGSNNVFYGNLIANNGGYGLAVGGIDIRVSNNLFYYNVFLNNSKNFGTNWQVIGTNFFDNGSVGNYWDDYLEKYPNATMVDDSGIGDIPYTVYDNVTDNYPVLEPFDISNITIQLPSWTKTAQPTISPTPSFPTAASSPQPTSSPQQLTPSFSATPTPSIPEFSWLVVVPLLLSIFAVALVLKYRKTTNSGLIV